MSNLDQKPERDGPPDWERIEADYRAGLLSVREIAADSGVSHTAIQKRAKAHGWERDLQAKIRAKADAMVARREVAKLVAAADLATERVLVDSNAQVITDVRMSHRQDIGRGRALVLKLLAEIETQTDHADLLEQLESAVLGGDSDALSKAYQRVVSTSGRVDNVKKLAESMKVLIAMEREAYSLDALPLASPALAPAFDYSQLTPATLRELRKAAADASPESP